MWKVCTFQTIVPDFVVNFLSFETVSDESVGGVLSFTI